jgi:hypothetical protein
VIPSDIPSASSQITADGTGGAIVVWEPADHTIRALRFDLDGPVPVLVSLVSAEATPEAVVLRWQGEGAGSLVARVERRTAAGEWQAVGRPTADGADALRYQDRTVAPGARYAYRLGDLDGGAQALTAETWVDVPAAYRLALEGFRPNPA